MEPFEIYCKTMQCFDEIEKLCLSRSFMLAKQKIDDENVIAKAALKCKKLMKGLKDLRQDASLMRKACQLSVCEPTGKKTGELLEQIDSILKKEQEDREYFNVSFKEAYRPEPRYAYENDYPTDEPRAKFLLWEPGANPYRDLQNIKRNKISDKAINLFEICDLFCDFRRILREDNAYESMSKEIEVLFATYQISLD